MSLFRCLFDSDWMRRADLERLNEKAGELEARVLSTRSKSATLESDVAELRRDVSGMMLMLETVVRVLADRGLCSREDFVARMRAVDAEDGIEDGQLKPKPPATREMRYCDACEHYSALRACNYCGRLFGTKKS